MAESSKASKKKPAKNRKNPHKKGNEKTQKNLITNYIHNTSSQYSGIINESPVLSQNYSIENETTSINSNFYEKCVKEKTKLCESFKNCHATKQLLKMRLKSLNEKHQQVQKAISTALQICGNKDKKIQHLEAQIIPPVDRHMTHQKSKTKIQFEDFGDIFTSEQLTELRSTNQQTAGDSTFVLSSIRFLYSDDLSKLANKTVFGIKKRGNKEPLTPQKVDRLRSLYRERLEYIKPENALFREEKFNRHVNHAIFNVCKKLNYGSNKKIIDVCNE